MPVYRARDIDESLVGDYDLVELYEGAPVRARSKATGRWENIGASPLTMADINAVLTDADNPKPVATPGISPGLINDVRQYTAQTEAGATPQAEARGAAASGRPLPEGAPPMNADIKTWWPEALPLPPKVQTDDGKWVDDPDYVLKVWQWVQNNQPREAEDTSIPPLPDQAPPQGFEWTYNGARNRWEPTPAKPQAEQPNVELQAYLARAQLDAQRQQGASAEARQRQQDALSQFQFLLSYLPPETVGQMLQNPDNPQFAFLENLWRTAFPDTQQREQQPSMGDLAVQYAMAGGDAAFQQLRDAGYFPTAGQSAPPQTPFVPGVGVSPTLPNTAPATPEDEFLSSFASHGQSAFNPAMIDRANSAAMAGERAIAGMRGTPDPAQDEFLATWMRTPQPQRDTAPFDADAQFVQNQMNQPDVPPIADTTDAVVASIVGADTTPRGRRPGVGNATNLTDAETWDFFGGTPEENRARMVAAGRSPMQAAQASGFYTSEDDQLEDTFRAANPPAPPPPKQESGLTSFLDAYAQTAKPKPPTVSRVRWS